MKKNQPKYPNMPMYIIKVGNRFKNTHSGSFVSDKELLAYTEGNIVNKEVKQQEIKQHWTSKYYGN